MSAGRKAKNGPQKLCDTHKNAAKNLLEIFWSADLIWRYFCGFFLFPWFFVAGSGLARVLALGPFHRHSTQRAGSGRAVDTGPGIRVWTFANKRVCARPRPLEKQRNHARKQKSTDQTVGAFLLMQAQHSGPSGESRTHGLLNPILVYILVYQTFRKNSTIYSHFFDKLFPHF